MGVDKTTSEAMTNSSSGNKEELSISISESSLICVLLFNGISVLFSSSFDVTFWSSLNKSIKITEPTITDIPNKKMV